MSNEGIKWRPTIEIIKYDARSIAAITRDIGHAPSGADLRELERLGLTEPDDVLVSEGNMLVSTGVSRITSLITGGGGAVLTPVLGFIGVGNSTTLAAVGQTALSGVGAGNAWYMGLDVTTGGPTLSTQTATNDTINVSSTFTTDNSQFIWNEWCVGIISSGTVTAAHTLASVGATPIILNRRVDSLGTKGAGSTWTLAAKIKLA